MQGCCASGKLAQHLQCIRDWHATRHRPLTCPSLLECVHLLAYAACLATDAHLECLVLRFNGRLLLTQQLGQRGPGALDLLDIQPVGRPTEPICLERRLRLHEALYKWLTCT